VSISANKPISILKGTVFSLSVYFLSSHQDALILSFLSLIALERYSTEVLNRSGKSEHLDIVLDISRNFILSPLSMMLVIDFFIDAFYQAKELLFYS